MKPVEIEFLMKNDTKTGFAEIMASSASTDQKLAMTQAVIARLREELDRMQAQMRANPTIDNSANIIQVEQFISALEGLEAQIKETGATATSVSSKVQTTPMTPTGVSQATQSFNGLHMSIQQIAREMPSLAMGPQMFFMAISNNLPVFADAVSRARLEYEALIKSGQKATPVWKQILTSMFSWQTALTTGIMLLVMYGDEIVDWASNLFKSTSKIESAQEAQDNLNKSIEEYGEKMGEREKAMRAEYNAVNQLLSQYGKANTSESERVRILSKLNEINPKITEGIDAEAASVDELTKRVGEYNEAQLKRIQLAALTDQEADVLKSYGDAQIEAARLKAKLESEMQAYYDKGTTPKAQYQKEVAFKTIYKEDTKRTQDLKEAFDNKDVEEVRRLLVTPITKKEYEVDNEIAYETYVDYAISTASNIEEAARLYNTALLNMQERKAELDETMESNRDLAAELGLSVTEYFGSTNVEIDPKPNPKPDFNDKEQDRKARIQAEQELEQELAALTRKNEKEQIELQQDSTQKRLAQIKYDYEVRAEEIRQQAAKFAELNKEVSGNEDLTPEQQNQINEAERLNTEQRQQAIGEVYKMEFEEMQESLKQYGAYYQQKLAIAAEYEEKINNAANTAEKESLTIQRDSALAHIEAQELKANIDWATIFGEFGGMFHELITPALADAQKYMQTDEFKNADQDSQKALVEAVQQMERSLGSGGADRVTFKKLGSEITAYQKKLSELRQAQEEYAGIYETLKVAQQAYVAAQQSGTEAEKESAAEALEIAQNNASAAETNIQTLQNSADAAQASITQTATRLKTGMDGVIDGLSQISSGSISGAYNGLITLGKGAKEIGGKLGDAFGKVADTLEDVPIVGWIVSIIDLFKDGLSVVIGGLLDAVFNAVSGILSDILSGDLFVTIGESLLQGVGKIFDALTWGGFSSWLGSGESDKSLKEDVERLTASNENLKDALDRLSEKMEEVATSEASDTYLRQKELLEQQIANTQEMMRRSGSAYSNGFLGIGGDKSTNHEINEGMSSADWKRISEIVGRTIDSAADFWSLSSEEMAKVKEEATDLYSKIEALADNGYQNAAQYMDEYIEYYRQLEELQEAYYEKLTNISFNSVQDEFKNQLLDMESNAESFAENFGEMMRNAIVESLMSEKYDDLLREWYVAFAEAMEDGVMTEQEKSFLQQWYSNIYEEGLRERDAYFDVVGVGNASVGSSQSGKSGAFETMTQDQGTKLEGLFTSGQMHWSSIDSKMDNVTNALGDSLDVLENIKRNTDSIPPILDELRKCIRDGIKVK